MKQRGQRQASIAILLSCWMESPNAWSPVFTARNGRQSSASRIRGGILVNGNPNPGKSRQSALILWSSSQSKTDLDAAASTTSTEKTAATSSENSIDTSKQLQSIPVTTTFSPGAAQNSDFDVVPLMDEDPLLLLLDSDDECFIGIYDNTTDIPSCVPLKMVTLPTHSNAKVNTILSDIQETLRDMHENHNSVDASLPERIQQAKVNGRLHEYIYANNYVDMGKIDTIGFDYDYTLVSYKEELLGLIYSKALERLVKERQYPSDMISSNTTLSYDPFFSIRGLAVDKETGWITHLSYTHKVAVAWEGRKKLPSSRIFEEYRGKRALTPSERKKRLKPLNDLFSMAECCLIADTIQFFHDHDIPFCPQNVVTDVLRAVTDAHISGDFHRMVASSPARYFEESPHLKDVLARLKESGKRLIFVSNSPFWYVNAGMKYMFGDDWRNMWDAIITSAGKPAFYTDDLRPFREICLDTSRPKFKKVERFEPGQVYTEGCLKELARLMDWSAPAKKSAREDSAFTMKSGTHDVATPHALYIGDSLFADLVDAKREFGWTTAAVTPEVGFETEIHNQAEFGLTLQSIDLLLSALRRMQDELGTGDRTEEDTQVLNDLEALVSQWRDRETRLLGNPFGSVFRARYQPSLFAHSLRRYCDLYMTSVSSLRNYSPQHRFYPESNGRLLAHEVTLMRQTLRPTKQSQKTS